MNIHKQFIKFDQTLKYKITYIKIIIEWLIKLPIISKDNIKKTLSNKLHKKLSFTIIIQILNDLKIKYMYTLQ